ncbi:hydrogen gas-evolving membrane-bound hydrogenase subunit E, partial [Arthrospira platensis SPKY1]|nr:hydrogen gas-evolving membrane-bound hydrogenase subunit E [Arthrospira platensis SPKY1]
RRGVYRSGGGRRDQHRTDSRHRAAHQPEVQGLKRLTLVLVLLICVLLLQAAMDLPNWSDPKSPASLHLSAHYLEKGLEETGVPNIVTAVLADYRSYDTLFEAVVVFAAGLIVLTLLRRTPRQRLKLVRPRPQRESQDIVLQGAARLLVPAIQV